MKVYELINLLKEYPDYNVEVCYADTSKCSYEHPWPDYTTLVLDGIDDVCCNKNVITLGCYER